MATTPKGERPQIVFVGPTNVGKSSLINALTDQAVSLVSPVPGTTTDPVYKAMELLPFGPVALVDTAGFNDQSPLGQQRQERTKTALTNADLAVVVTDHPQRLNEEIIALLAREQIPYLQVLNKGDLLTNESIPDHFLVVSSKTKEGIDELKEAIVEKLSQEQKSSSIVGDLVSPGDLVLLVVPIDEQAPKGRLILPQVQTIRDLLDHHCQVLVVRDSELSQALEGLKASPCLVITDSRIFREVAQRVGDQIPLTSFSILFARYKGDLPLLVEGAAQIERLQTGDHILICEACTHRPSTEDIGRVKIPALLQKKVNGPLHFTWAVGQDFPEDLSPYKLAVHCGGCMVTRKTVLQRLKRLQKAGIPVVNYGVLLAYFSGILERALEPVM